MIAAAPRRDKEVILIGGGHTHVLFLKMWADMPQENVRITLISPSVLTPYSGMLPGFIAGHYTYDQSHIDLSRLCQLAGVRFIQAAVVKIESKKQTVHLSGRPPLYYDCASINTGITPDTTVRGSAQHSIPIKPISELNRHWQSLLSRVTDKTIASAAIRIGVVGGGAAAVEFIQAVAWKFSKEPTVSEQEIQLTLIQAGAGLPENYPSAVQNSLKRQFQKLNIKVAEHFSVEEVRESDDGGYDLISKNRSIITLTDVFWCTHAKGAQWTAESDIAIDDSGFIKTNNTLEVIDANCVFAVGDCATIVSDPRPKAGVFAVRQARTLFRNLLAKLDNRALVQHKSQASFLSILTGGSQWAVASKGRFAIGAVVPHWVWLWKRSIDQSFMDQFLSHPKRKKMNMPKNSTRDNSSNADKMRCGGCGSKIGSTILARVLDGLAPISKESVLLGVSSADDCAVITPSENKHLCQSVDVLTALVSDPYIHGKIAAEHALSDLFAMGAKPHSAQAIVALPDSSEVLAENDLRLIMAGALDVLNHHDCALIGGHTSEAVELSVGFSVNGFIETESLIKKTTPQAGDFLILTKPLGVGMLFAAHNQAQAKGVWIEKAIDSMLHSNAAAADIARQFDARAMTDVTGFGLLGHLLEMLSDSTLSGEINLDTLPLLEGAIDVCALGVLSSLDPQNRKQDRHLLVQCHNHPKLPFLFDPQTSGGLLIAVEQGNAQACIEALKIKGYTEAKVIGRLSDTQLDSNQIVQATSNA